MVSNRRISEAPRLRGTDINLDGGLHHDKPYIWLGRRTSNTSQEDFAGLGKLGADEVLSRISDEAVETIRALAAIGITWDALPPLPPYTESHAAVFEELQPFNKRAFHPKLDDKLWFPSLKKSQLPWMTRQTVWNAIHRMWEARLKLTRRRRYNPDSRFNGAHVTVHGATRHTAAGLLMFSPKSAELKPTEETILDIQQRSDARTFRKHYHHVHDKDVESALKFSWEPPPFPTHPVGGETDAIQRTADADGIKAERGASPSSGLPRDQQALPAEAPERPSDPGFPSRNAWRRKKRRDAHAAWLISQGSLFF